MKGKNIIAIIPARGGSKRILRKNIKDFAGKPLIYYSIFEAKKSKYINQVIVSTEDEDIAKTAKEFGAKIILRPKELAKDESSIIRVLQQTIEFLKEKEKYETDIVVLLQPTSPLRTVDDIDKCITKQIETGADSVETFCPVKEHPAMMFKIENGEAIPIDPENLPKRSQDLPKLYVENGAVYVITKDVLKQNTVYGKLHVPILMSRKKSIDIDDEIDFQNAEKAFKKARETK